MIPTKLKLSNFTSYRTDVPELDFTKFKLAAISGSNGAGKSSLLDSITWCVWGVSRLGDSSDQLVRLGQTQMFVEFSFELDKNIFTVKRQRELKSGGTTSLEFLSGKNNLTEGTIKATQQKIIDTLHLSYETFTNSAFLRQGHADEFTTKGPTDRKRILADILGLSHYDILEEKAKEKIKEIQSKLQLLEYQILEIEAELTQKEERSQKKKTAEEKITQLEKEIKELEEKLKIKRELRETLNLANGQREKLEQLYTQNKKELDEILSQGKSRKEKISLLEEELTKLSGVTEELSKLQPLQEEKEKMDHEHQKELEIKNLLSDLMGQISLKKQQEESLKNEVEKLNSQLKESAKSGAKCPTCGQEIGKLEKDHVSKELTNQITNLQKDLSRIDYALAEKEKTKLESVLKELIFNPEKYADTNRQIQSLLLLQDKKEKAVELKATIETEQKVRVEMLSLYQNKNKQVEEQRLELEKYPDLSKQLAKINQEILQTENQLSLTRNEEKEARGTLGQINELMSRTAQLEKTLTSQNEKKISLQKEKGIYEELSLAFGKKGIQAMIIETAIPELEEETNRLLDKLTEGRMKVRFETQKETKTKVNGEHGIVETLDIIISDEMGERPYEGYSVDGSELVYVRQNGQIHSLPIETLWKDNGPIEIDGNYQFQKSNLEALCYHNGSVCWQKVDKILRHPSPQKIIEVTAGPGNYSVKLTKNHSVYVFTEEGIKVKCTEALKKGDFLLSPRTIPAGNYLSVIDFTHFISDDFTQKRSSNDKPLNYSDQFIWSRNDQKINRFLNLNKKSAEFIGLAVAEGSGQTAYSIAVGKDRALAKKATLLAASVFGNNKRTLGYVSENQMKQYIQTTPGISAENPKAQFRPDIGGRLVAHIMKNMVGKTAATKKAPDFIFNSPQEIKLAFLKGLVKGDGHLSVYKEKSKSSVNITTVSSQLAGDLIFLCRQLGIWARIENHGKAGLRRNMNHQKSYRVVISGKKNLEILGLGAIVTSYSVTTKYDGIPCSLIGINRISNQRFQRGVKNQVFACGVNKIPLVHQQKYQQIQELIKDWNILEVKKIKEVKPASKYVYDLMVPGNNSFVAGNGAILVHNSGGEQFRVNFAIRLALSRLLTHRAGAKLQFLVIDEGFGTQDAQGRARIVEALDIIKDDFEKIIVITHLEELKEEFPVRIEVSKNPTGSTFEVVGI